MYAPAKINLYLNLLGRRSDGYHLLDTLIAFTDINDEVYIDAASEFSLQITGEFAPSIKNGEENIVTRAYRLMAKECCRQDSVSIRLVKNIPVGAGLGGGSADAAATLFLLNDLWKVGLPKARLCEIGLMLGADVPVFINRRAAFVSGIGEDVSNIGGLPQLYAVLVYPNKPLATAGVFALSPLRAGEVLKLSHNNNQIATYSTKEQWIKLMRDKGNDLEKLAISILPEIATIIAKLSANEGCDFAGMSGSGSTCFGVFTDKKLAEKCAAELVSNDSGLWVKVTNIIDCY